MRQAAPSRFSTEPEIGWRWWRWDLLAEELRPWFFFEDGRAWAPRKASIAKCCAAQVLRNHDHPDRSCTCGFWAFRDESDMHEYGDGKDVILLGFVPVYGQVSLWGSLIEHEYGWRASKAYPYTIKVPSSELHRSVDEEPEEVDTRSVALRIANRYAIDAEAV